MREFFRHAFKPLALLACLAAPVAFAAPKITNVQIVDETGTALSDETFAEGETVTFEVTFDTVLNTQESELANFRLVLNYPKTNVDSAEYSAVYAANGSRVAGSPTKLRFTYTVRPGDIVTGLHATSTSGTLSCAGLSFSFCSFCFRIKPGTEKAVTQPVNRPAAKRSRPEANTFISIPPAPSPILHIQILSSIVTAVSNRLTSVCIFCHRSDLFLHFFLHFFGKFHTGSNRRCNPVRALCIRFKGVPELNHVFKKSAVDLKLLFTHIAIVCKLCRCSMYGRL